MYAVQQIGVGLGVCQGVGILVGGGHDHVFPLVGVVDHFGSVESVHDAVALAEEQSALQTQFVGIEVDGVDSLIGIYYALESAGGEAYVEPSVADKRRAVLVLYDLRVGLPRAACQAALRLVQRDAAACGQGSMDSERVGRATVDVAHVVLRAVQQIGGPVVADAEHVESESRVLYAQRYVVRGCGLFLREQGRFAVCDRIRGDAAVFVYGADRRAAAVVGVEVDACAVAVVYVGDADVVTEIGVERAYAQRGGGRRVACRDAESLPLLFEFGAGTVAFDRDVGRVGQEQPRAVGRQAAHDLARVVEIAPRRLSYEGHAGEVGLFLRGLGRGGHVRQQYAG